MEGSKYLLYGKKPSQKISNSVTHIVSLWVLLSLYQYQLYDTYLISIQLVSYQLYVGKHIELTDKQTGTETKKRTFTDVINKGKLPRDLLSKRPMEQLKEVFGKELSRSGRAS